jgi:small-conductance mechanosensitive channel
MAEKNAPSQSSIISVIREMVKSGESEENIIASLNELGINPKDAKKLLLLGEADTFALLQSEINKMVKEYFDREKPEFEENIREEVKKEELAMTDKVEKRALSAFKEDQKFIENQATMFQARINQSVKNILQLNEQTRQQIADLGGRVSNNERETWSLKDRIYGSRMVGIVSMILVALEIGLVGTTAYMFLTGFGGAPENMLVVAAAIGLILATMIFLIRLKI